MIRKFSIAMVAGAAGLTLLLAGCSGGDEPSPSAASTAAAPAAPAAAGGGATSATLQMEDIKFDKTALSAKVGAPLTLELTNAGALEHDFVIEKIDAKATLDGKDAKGDKFAIQASLKSKATGNLEITPTTAGAYEFFCSVPGNKEAGMMGTLTVK